MKSWNNMKVDHQTRETQKVTAMKIQMIQMRKYQSMSGSTWPHLLILKLALNLMEITNQVLAYLINWCIAPTKWKFSTLKMYRTWKTNMTISKGLKNKIIWWVTAVISLKYSKNNTWLGACIRSWVRVHLGQRRMTHLLHSTILRTTLPSVKTQKMKVVQAQ